MTDPRGPEFRAVRQLADVPIRQVAAEADIHHTTVSRWERGERDISQATYDRLVSVLNDIVKRSTNGGAAALKIRMEVHPRGADPVTETVTAVNLHQPVRAGSVVECAAPDCDYVVAGFAHFDDDAMRKAFDRSHGNQYKPGRAPNITVDWEISADCSICRDGGHVRVVDSETIECSKCGTTWSMDGTGGWRQQ